MHTKCNISTVPRFLVYLWPALSEHRHSWHIKQSYPSSEYRSFTFSMVCEVCAACICVCVPDMTARPSNFVGEHFAHIFAFAQSTTHWCSPRMDAAKRHPLSAVFPSMIKIGAKTYNDTKRALHKHILCGENVLCCICIPIQFYVLPEHTYAPSSSAVIIVLLDVLVRFIENKNVREQRACFIPTCMCVCAQAFSAMWVLSDACLYMCFSHSQSISMHNTFSIRSEMPLIRLTKTHSLSLPHTYIYRPPLQYRLLHIDVVLIAPFTLRENVRVSFGDVKLRKLWHTTRRAWKNQQHRESERAQDQHQHIENDRSSSSSSSRLARILVYAFFFSLRWKFRSHSH